MVENGWEWVGKVGNVGEWSVMGWNGGKCQGIDENRGDRVGILGKGGNVGNDREWVGMVGMVGNVY